MLDLFGVPKIWLSFGMFQLFDYTPYFQLIQGKTSDFVFFTLEKLIIHAKSKCKTNLLIYYISQSSNQL